MAIASTVLISTPLGAGKKEEARSNAYRLLGFSVLLGAVFGILIFLSRNLIPILYRDISPSAQKVAKDVLLVQACLFWVYMSSAQCYFTLRAGGDMKNTLIIDSGFMWLVNIPAAAFVTYGTALPYLWPYLASQATDFIKLAFSFRMMRREQWVVNLTETTETLKQ